MTEGIIDQVAYVLTELDIGTADTEIITLIATAIVDLGLLGDDLE